MHKTTESNKETSEQLQIKLNQFDLYSPKSQPHLLV